MTPAEVRNRLALNGIRLRDRITQPTYLPTQGSSVIDFFASALRAQAAHLAYP